MTSVAEELQSAAQAIRESTMGAAVFHRAVADLFDQVALSAPYVEMQLPPITRKALAAARAYRDLFPLAPASDSIRRCQYCGHKVAQLFDVDGAWCSDEHKRFDRGNEETWWRKAVER